MSSLYFFREGRVRYLVKGLPHCFLSPSCFIRLPHHWGRFGPIFSRSLAWTPSPFLSAVRTFLCFDIFDRCTRTTWWYGSGRLTSSLWSARVLWYLEVLIFLQPFFLAWGLVVLAPLLYPCSSRVQFGHWMTYYSLVPPFWSLGSFWTVCDISVTALVFVRVWLLT